MNNKISTCFLQFWLIELIDSWSIRKLHFKWTHTHTHTHTHTLREGSYFYSSNPSCPHQAVSLLISRPQRSRHFLPDPMMPRADMCSCNISTLSPRRRCTWAHVMFGDDEWINEHCVISAGLSSFMPCSSFSSQICLTHTMSSEIETATSVCSESAVKQWRHGRLFVQRGTIESLTMAALTGQ